MATTICCLRRLGKVSKNDRLVPLVKDKESGDTKSTTLAVKLFADHLNDYVTIGRLDTNTVCILDTMISKKHAVLKKEGDTWTIMDNKSLNGIFINSTKIEPLKPYMLVDGDKVQLGIDRKGTNEPDYVYEFLSALKVKVSTVIKRTVNSSQSSSQSSKRQKLDSLEQDNRVSSSQELEGDGAEHKSKECENDPCHRKKGDGKTIWSPSTVVKQKLDEQEEMHKKQLEDVEAKVLEMQEQLRAKESLEAKMMEEMKRREEEMKSELEKQRVMLEKERLEFEAQMKQKLESEVQEKEDALKAQLALQRENLIQEKKLVEEKLQQEMEQKLEEKDKAKKEELRAEKEKLEQIIANKEAEQKLLESQLNETKSENEKTKDSMLRAREDLLSNFEDVMETELQCSICSELFVQATSLNCAHSYCSYCISQWMDRKKECPQCRKPITSNIRSIVLDSYIDKMVEQLSDEMKERRKKMVEDRKAEQAALDAQKQAQTQARGRGAGRGRGNRQQRNRNNRNNTTAAGRARPTPPTNTNQASTNVNPPLRPGQIPGPGGPSNPHQNPVIYSLDQFRDENGVLVLRSDTDSESGSAITLSSPSEDSSDEEEVEGEPGAYYGGYGHCYRCGHRGHWANGCPFF